MLVDTVGLIRRLPHKLVEAFKSTLEEATAATVILNVCDASDEYASEHLEVTKNLLKELNLEVSALCGDMGGFGFERAEDNPQRIQKTKEIIDLALEFGAKVVTTHIGVIPEDKSNPRYKVMLDALTECGLYAKERGVTLAIETGPEKATTLLQFIEDTKGGVGVNFDPANFTMVTGQDAVEGVYILRDHIVHTHAKDGIMLERTLPEYIYKVIPKPEDIQGIKFFKEVPLGEGGVDFKSYLKALEEIGYRGFLTIEREAGDTPELDISIARDHLLNIIKAN
jgi:sugar phosphate isomerase/epimerase